MKPIPLDPIERVVVVRTDHIGDLIVSTPFLTALHHRLPQAHITAVVPPAAREVLVGNPAVDAIVPVRRGLDLAGLNAQLAICLAPRTAAYRLTRSSRARYRVGYFYPERPLSRLTTLYWLTHRIPVDVRAQLNQGRPVPHEIEQLGQLAGALGLDYGDPELCLPVDEATTAWAAEQLPEPPQVAVHLSPGWLTEDWELSDLVQLVESLPPPVLITYGPGELDLAAQARPRLPGVTWLGNLTLKQWAGALERAACVLSTDTGAVHVAAARKRPVVVAYQRHQYALCVQQWAPWKTPYRGLAKQSPAESLPKLREAVEELLESSRNSPPEKFARGD